MKIKPNRVIFDFSESYTEHLKVKEDLKFSSQDIIFSCFESWSVNEIDIHDAYLLPDYENSMRNSINDLNNTINNLSKINSDLHDAIASNELPLWDSNLSFVHKWLHSIEDGLKDLDTSESVFLFPKAPSTGSIFLYEAEGETSNTVIKRLLYRRTDFLLNHVQSFVVNNFSNNFMYYENKSWKLNLRIRIIIRIFCLLIFSFSLHLRNILKFKLKKSGQSHSSTANQPILAVVRSSTHINYYHNLDHLNLVFLDFSHPRNGFLKDEIFKGRQSFSLYKFIDLSIILNIFLDTLKKIFRFYRSKQDSVLRIKNIDINLDVFVYESLVKDFDARILELSLSKFVQSIRTNLILHSENFTNYNFYFDKVSKKLKKKSLQIAFDSYGHELQPKFIFSDYFLCFSQLQQNILKSLYPNEKRIIYKGNFSYDTSLNSLDYDQLMDLRKENKRILFFSQPYSNLLEKELLASLEMFCLYHNYILTVITHPRDNKNKFSFLGQETEVVENSKFRVESDTYEADAYFAITRVSGVGSELFLKGIPLINAVLENETAKPSHQLEYITFNKLHAYSLKDINNLLMDTRGSFFKFVQSRNEYLNAAYSLKGKQDAEAFILSFEEGTIHEP